MFVTAPLSSRNEFGKLLTERGLTSTAVEIGTHRGGFARVLLATWAGHLDCVDPWADPPGYEVQSAFLPDRGTTREDDYRAALKSLRTHAHRVRLVRKTSAGAVDSYNDRTLDFVYLDGDHEYEGVYHDLTTWWPKVRPGGILAGHDVVTPGESRGWSVFVQRALDRFLTTLPAGRDTVVHLVVEEGLRPWSFYLEKPE